MNPVSFCLWLKKEGKLKEGIRSGAISSEHATWADMISYYRSLSGMPEKEKYHSISVKFNCGYNWAYKIVKKYA